VRYGSSPSPLCVITCPRSWPCTYTDVHVSLTPPTHLSRRSLTTPAAAHQQPPQSELEQNLYRAPSTAAASAAAAAAALEPATAAAQSTGGNTEEQPLSGSLTQRALELRKLRLRICCQFLSKLGEWSLVAFRAQVQDF